MPPKLRFPSRAAERLALVADASHACLPPPPATRVAAAMKTSKLALARAIAAAAVLWAPIVSAHGSSPGDAKSQVIRLVEKIQRDDYEGNRAALQQDFADLAPFVSEAELSARVRYWRGFALWRRTINGFNETVDAKEQEKDLKGAIDELAQIPEADAVYGDARIGMVSCLGYLLY